MGRHKGSIKHDEYIYRKRKSAAVRGIYLFIQGFHSNACERRINHKRAYDFLNIIKEKKLSHTRQILYWMRSYDFSRVHQIAIEMAELIIQLITLFRLVLKTRIKLLRFSRYCDDKDFSYTDGDHICCDGTAWNDICL